MKPTIIFLILTTIVTIICGAEKAPARNLDEQLIEILLDYHDVPTGVFKKTKMPELLGLVRKVGAYHEAGFGSVSKNVVRWSYRFNESSSPSKESDYGFEIFTAGQGSDMESYDVIYIRLTFITPSGNVFYNNITPTNDTPCGLK